MRSLLPLSFSALVVACSTVPRPIAEPAEPAVVALQGEVRRLAGRGKRAETAWRQMHAAWAALAPSDVRARRRIYLRDRFRLDSGLWIAVEEELSATERSLFRAVAVCDTGAATPKPHSLPGLGPAYDRQVRPRLMAYFEDQGLSCRRQL